MADDFFFMGKEPLGLVTEAAWFLFDLNMLPRAFVKYCLELYFIEAEVNDQVLIVSNFFALLPRGDECIFDEEYGITDVFDQLDEQIFAIHHDESLAEHTGWAIELLTNLMKVPKLGVLPEIIAIIDFPANNLATPLAVVAEPAEPIVLEPIVEPLEPVLTPFVLTVAELEAIYALTPVGRVMRLTPRQLEF
jgi:hypothetical protein